MWIVIEILDYKLVNWRFLFINKRLGIVFRLWNDNRVVVMVFQIMGVGNRLGVLLLFNVFLYSYIEINRLMVFIYFFIFQFCVFSKFVI